MRARGRCRSPGTYSQLSAFRRLRTSPSRRRSLPRTVEPGAPEAGAQPVSEDDLVGQPPQLDRLDVDALRPQLAGEPTPVALLHVALRPAAERLVGAHHHARRLGDVALRHELPDAGLLAGAAQALGPAAVVEQGHAAAVVEHGLVAGGHGPLARVGALAQIGDGLEADHR